MHIGVTAMAKSDNVVTVLSIATTFTVMCTWLSQVKTDNAIVIALSVVTAARTAVTALSVSPLSQRCQLSPLPHKL